MRHDRIVPGAILITLGVIFLLRSFGYIHIHWINILHLWPIFLLIAGINLIFAHNRSPLATILKVGVVIAGICLLLFGSFNNRFSMWPGYYSFHNNRDNSDDDDNDFDDNSDKIVKIEGNSMFAEPFHADAKVGKLSISGGAATYMLGDTTSQLLEASAKEYGSQYQFDHHNEDSVYVFDFSMKKNTHFRWKDGKGNEAVFKLNTKPVWDLDFQGGAAKMNFDLTKFKVRNLSISGGAASFDVKMGQPLAETKLDISTGVSEVKISVPKNAACKIDTDSGLTSNNFEGFTKVDDNTYQTPGFEAAKNKTYISFDGGMSDFKVTRY